MRYIASRHVIKYCLSMYSNFEALWLPITAMDFPMPCKKAKVDPCSSSSTFGTVLISKKFILLMLSDS